MIMHNTVERYEAEIKKHMEDQLRLCEINEKLEKKNKQLSERLLYKTI